MVTDEDYLTLTRELCLLLLEVQVELATLRLAAQKLGLSFEEIQQTRREAEIGIPFERTRAQIRASGRVDIVEWLKGFSSGTVH